MTERMRQRARHTLRLESQMPDRSRIVLSETNHGQENARAEPEAVVLVREKDDRRLENSNQGYIKG